MPGGTCRLTLSRLSVLHGNLGAVDRCERGIGGLPLQNADGVLITVSDCGPGLPPDELDRVFTPFYRLDASRNRSTGGAGLGLAIVKSCVEASGGTVQCRNREPHGLAVEIRLRPHAVRLQQP